MNQNSGPTPPTNVRLHYADGRAVPAECIYDGERDGMHVWTVVSPENFSGIVNVTVGTLPAKTRLQVPLEE